MAPEAPEQSYVLKHRRSSIEIVAEEGPLWVDSHPLKPIFPLVLKLAKFIVWSGPQWIFRICSMLLFILILSPAFLQVAWYYLTSIEILRNIKFGPNPRNFLDVYLPNEKQNTSSKRPVVIFISGGVWIIGYKGWGAFMGKIFASYGIITVQPDYRNFPQGTVEDMVDDVNRSIAWVYQNVELFGGNPNEIYIMGQSAGAHLGCLTVLKKALQEASQENGPSLEENGHIETIYDNGHARFQFTIPNKNNWKLANVKACIGVSGPYNLIKIENHFDYKGLPKRLLHAIFGGKKKMNQLSPTLLLKENKEFTKANVVSRIPKMILLHGTNDTSVHYTETTDFDYWLCKRGADSFVKLYPTHTHTDGILEKLICIDEGMTDDLMFDVVAFVTQKFEVHKGDSPETVFPKRLHQLSFNAPNEEKLKNRSIHRSLLPQFMVSTARFINPF